MTNRSPRLPLSGKSQEFFQSDGIVGGRFGNESSNVGEVNVRLALDSRHVDARMVAETSESIARTTSIGVDQDHEFFDETSLFDISFYAHRRLIGQRIGSGKKERPEIAMISGERPDFGVLLNEGQSPS